MIIERNLFSPLRSMVERIVETKQQIDAASVIVSEDRGQRRQEQPHHDESADDEVPQGVSVQSIVEDTEKTSPSLTRRLDLIV